MHNMLVGQIIPHFRGNFVVKFIAGMELFPQKILYTVCGNTFIKIRIM